MKNKLEVGQVLFDRHLKEYEINRVGRKYFYIRTNYQEYKYPIDTLRSVSDYGPRDLYVSAERPQNEIDRGRITGLIRDKIDVFNTADKNLTLAQLRAIEKIINDDKTDVQTKN